MSSLSIHPRYTLDNFFCRLRGQTPSDNFKKNKTKKETEHIEQVLFTITTIAHTAIPARIVTCLRAVPFFFLIGDYYCVYVQSTE